MSQGGQRRDSQGGSEAIHSNTALGEAIATGLAQRPTGTSRAGGAGCDRARSARC